MFACHQVNEYYLGTLQLELRRKLEESRAWQRWNQAMTNADASSPIGWFVGNPWNGQRPDRVHVIGKEAVCHVERPRIHDSAYPGTKIGVGMFDTGLHINEGFLNSNAVLHPCNMQSKSVFRGTV